MNWVSGKVKVCTLPGWLVSSVPSSFTSTTCRRGWYLWRDCRTTICQAEEEEGGGRGVRAAGRGSDARGKGREGSPLPAAPLSSPGDTVFKNNDYIYNAYTLPTGECRILPEASTQKKNQKKLAERLRFPH